MIKLGKVIMLLVLMLLFVEIASAETIKVGTVYGGNISNEIDRDVSGMNLDLKDSGRFGGLYLQVIDPAKYQGNMFIYGSDNVNNSKLFGIHSIVDYYPLGTTDFGKYVIGAGFEYINMKTEMDEYEVLTNFELKQNIYAPFIRTGNYFYFGSNKFKYSFMPWIGFESDIVKGDLYFDLPPNPYGPPFIESTTDTTDYFALAGLNVNIKYHHFVDLKLKYNMKKDLSANEYLQNASALLNVYFNRNWGISYRLKYMESSEMTNVYNIGGIIYSF